MGHKKENYNNRKRTREQYSQQMPEINMMCWQKKNKYNNSDINRHNTDADTTAPNG